MKYDFDEMIDRTQAASIKWAAEQRERMFGEKDILPMGIADMDFKAAPAVARAVQERAAHETYGYCYASDEYLQACVDWQRRRNGWEIRPEWIVYTPGVNMALVCAIEMYAARGEQVIIQSPVYYPYYDYVEKTGRKIVLNPLVRKNGRYEINFEQLEELAADPKTKIMLLCSPHNPVGRAWTREELERVGRICIDRGVMIAVDEIHSDLVYEPRRHVPFAAISEEFAAHSIICTSPSKTFNLAGLLVSDIIIPDDRIRAAFQEKMEPYYLWPGCFGAAAQIAAYTEGEEWLEELLAYLKGNACFIADFIRERMPRVKYTVPEATYLAWLDFGDYGMSREELWNLMIHEARVATDNGPKFGLQGEGDGFQRLNFACSRKRLEEGLVRIADALDRHEVSFSGNNKD